MIYCQKIAFQNYQQVHICLFQRIIPSFRLRLWRLSISNVLEVTAWDITDELHPVIKNIYWRFLCTALANHIRMYRIFLTFCRYHGETFSYIWIIVKFKIFDLYLFLEPKKEKDTHSEPKYLCLIILNSMQQCTVKFYTRKIVKIKLQSIPYLTKTYECSHLKKNGEHIFCHFLKKKLENKVVQNIEFAWIKWI